LRLSCCSHPQRFLAAALTLLFFCLAMPGFVTLARPGLEQTRFVQAHAVLPFGCLTAGGPPRFARFRCRSTAATKHRPCPAKLAKQLLGVPRQRYYWTSWPVLVCLVWVFAVLRV